MLADVAEPLADGEQSDSDEDITITKGDSIPCGLSGKVEIPPVRLSLVFLSALVRPSLSRRVRVPVSRLLVVDLSPACVSSSNTSPLFRTRHDTYRDHHDQFYQARVTVSQLVL